MKKAAKFLIFICLLCISTHAEGESRPFKSEKRTTQIHFRWDSAVLDSTYMDNGDAIKNLRQTIASIQGAELVELVVIYSHSSPDGNHIYNQNLSARRAKSVQSFLQHNFPQIASSIAVNSNGESWDALSSIVATDNNLSWQAREKIVSIIEDKTISIYRRKELLSALPEYGYLYRTIYPTIRNTIIELVIRKPIPFESQIFDHSKHCFTLPQISLPIEPLRFGLRRGDTQQAKQPEQPKLSEQATTQELSSTIKDTLTFALKTNMLYDLATVINAEVEAPIGNHFSVLAEVNAPWWESNNKFCVQLQTVGAEARYWFSKNKYHNEKLRGHFVGIYSLSGRYDLQLDRKLCYQGEGWSVGATYGYVMPISHRYPINLELSLSVGYLSTAYQHYYPAPDYSELWIDTDKKGRVNYFGPTKLKVSLQIPINISYSKRGGSR